MTFNVNPDTHVVRVKEQTTYKPIYYHAISVEYVDVGDTICIITDTTGDKHIYGLGRLYYVDIIDKAKMPIVQPKSGKSKSSKSNKTRLIEDAHSIDPDDELDDEDDFDNY